MKINKAIPTNLITGFLGVGKTTAIRQLMSSKPAGERWAVLVNEFGEIGVDASLLAAQSDDKDVNVFVREVPGGCMCCAAGLPMQVALNQLIVQAKPERLLIEPSGLGHPHEIKEALLRPEYTQIIDLRTVVTLVDARKIADSRYTGHAIFNQQLEVADKIVANKSDLYSSVELDQLRNYLNQHGCGDAVLAAVTQGKLEPHWLDEYQHVHSNLVGEAARMSRVELMGTTVAGISEPEQGFIRRSRREGEFFYQGWFFSAACEFEADRISSLMHDLTFERLKGVFKVGGSSGLAVNLAEDILRVVPVTAVAGSRLEIIDTGEIDHPALESRLLSSLRTGVGQRPV